MSATDNILAFRKANAEPESEFPIKKFTYLKDYGPPCNDMTVSLAEAEYQDGTTRRVLVLCGPHMDMVGLFYQDAMDDETRDLMGRSLYRVLYHATMPPTVPAA